MKCKPWLLNWLKLNGGVKPEGTAEITENGTYDVAEYAEAEVNVSGGADLSEYFYLEVFGTNSLAEYGWANNNIMKLPDNLTVKENVRTLRYCFNNMKELVTATLFDTSSIIETKYMFSGCTKLRDVPIYDTTHLLENNPSMEYMFTGCNSLSDESLDNILVMCINAPANVSGRNLSRLGLTATYYPVSKIEALPHYQEFRSANWTIGY